MRLNYFLFLLLASCYFCGAQELGYTSLTIPDKIKENANSVIRFQSIAIEITSIKSIATKTKKVVTVLNKYGLNNIDAKAYYSKSEKVAAIEATIYDAFGKEIKKIKRKDFIDQSVADGFSVLTDGRFYALNYTPTAYPFTVVYESETESSNTAFIPSWYIIDDFYESVIKSEYSLTYPSNLGFKYKEYNIDPAIVQKKETPTSITFTAENLLAEKPEDFSPSLTKLLPSIKFGLNKFVLEGVEGSANTWEEYGKWTYDALLKDTEELSEETKSKVIALIGNETNPVTKAKIIYKYVQDKTRYVSVQLGIGGWKPMLAKDVDRLGYGDCKALSNYTRVLLKAVGVESYYTEIYGSSDKKDFEKDFVSMQGNHVVLALPTKDKLLFLECTSQTAPFAYQGTFTDDRYAVLIKPTGGECVKTNEYTEKASSQISKGNYSIDANGNFSGAITIKSRGIQYNKKDRLESDSADKIDEHYKDYFSWINNLKLEKIKFNNNKDEVEFVEDLKISASNYASLNGKMMMFPLNAFNQSVSVPQRYRNRKNPFEVSRGYYDEDEIEIMLPEGFTVDAKPENVTISEKFGEYKVVLIANAANKLVYKRSLLIKKGYFDKSEYDNYRLFREKIARADNSKIVLTQK